MSSKSVSSLGSDARQPLRTIILSVVMACMAIACGGAVDPDRSFAVAEEMKWGPGWIPGQIPSTGPVPADCVRIEDAEIGENLTLSFSGRALTFTGWTSKADERGEYVGFAFAASGPVGYAVKAGLETHYGTDSAWTHPAGHSGKSAKGIGNITFCPGAPSHGGAPSDGGTTSDGGPTGGGPARLGGGAACAADDDCLSGDCASNVCSLGGAGTECVVGPRDCASQVCTSGVCAPPLSGRRGDPCTVADNCWSGICDASATCQGGAEGDSCRASNADCRIDLICDTTTNTCSR